MVYVETHSAKLLLIKSENDVFITLDKRYTSITYTRKNIMHFQQFLSAIFTSFQSNSGRLSSAAPSPLLLTHACPHLLLLHCFPLSYSLTQQKSLHKSKNSCTIIKHYRFFCSVDSRSFVIRNQCKEKSFVLYALIIK